MAFAPGRLRIARRSARYFDRLFYPSAPPQFLERAEVSPERWKNKGVERLLAEELNLSAEVDPRFADQIGHSVEGIVRVCFRIDYDH